MKSKADQLNSIMTGIHAEYHNALANAKSPQEMEMAQTIYQARLRDPYSIVRNKEDYNPDDPNEDYFQMAARLQNEGMSRSESFTEADGQMDWDKEHGVLDDSPEPKGSAISMKPEKGGWKNGVLAIPSDQGGKGLVWKPYNQYYNSKRGR